MIANYTSKPAAPIAEYPQASGRQAGSRHYDSFIVRLWQDEGSDAMVRVELQHVQAGLSIEAVQVPLDWIVPGIMECLQSPSQSQTSAVPTGEDAR